VAAIAAFPSNAVPAPPDNQKVLLQKARQQFVHAQELEAAINDRPPARRTRDEYLNVIKAYQRVYLITPRTPFADDALMKIASLYEELKDTAAELRTLKFLIHDYPNSPFCNTAEKDIARLQGTAPEKKLSGNAVENIRYWEAGNSVRVLVDLTAVPDFRQGEAKSPDRVFIDIAQSRLNSALAGKPMPVGSPLLQQIRAAQFDTSTVRIVLDVGAASRVTSFALHDPERLIIDVAGNETKPPSPTTPVIPSEPAALATASPASAAQPKTVAAKLDAAPASRPPAVRRPEKKAAEPKPEPKLAPADTKFTADEPKIVPAKPTSNGDRSLIRSLGLKLQRVIIDPGHGGHDTGTIGPSGYEEKELVLDVSKRLKELIEKELGAEVVLTRDDDTFIPLETRTAIANQHEGDLFISVHANSSRVRSVRGVETFFLNLTTSRESLDIATRENAASEHSIHELQELSKKILLQDKIEESRELARVMQKSMSTRRNSGIDRGVKQAPFIVLMGANMPSVLTEISFISNPQEEKLLRTADYRQSIAESLLAGVKSYSESLSGLKTAKIQDKN
jgi:N-acetylmuramoyl-L-alanine amidase